MSGLLGDLSPAQAETLVKYRKVLSEEQLLRKKDDDYTLLRFLKARGFDVEKAKAMFRSMLEWRREVGADTINKVFEFPERKATLLLYPRFHHKTDRLGRPIYIERLGHLRVDELLKITTLDRVFMSHVFDWEVLIDSKFPACSEKVDRDVRQTLTILDLKGVTPKHMSKPVRQFIQKIAKVDQDYYPEYLGKMIIINAPVAFKAMWTAVKPWIDKRTKKKIEMYGGNFAAKLLELVEKEDLPEFLGGSCRCVGGCENSDAGPWNVAAESSIDSHVIA